MNCEFCQNKVFQQWNLKEFIFCKQLKRYDICKNCRDQFEEIGNVFCPGCGRQQFNSRLCDDCKLWEKQGQQLLNNRALYCYNHMMKRYFREYKFKGGYHLKSLFRGEIEKIIETDRTLVVIPITSDKLRKRCFNQTCALLKEQTPWVDILKCHKDFKSTQSKKTRVQRMNTQQWFELSVDQKQIENKKFTLIDDIYTTGRTLYHAADCLYQANAKNVNSITLIR